MEDHCCRVQSKYQVNLFQVVRIIRWLVKESETAYMYLDSRKEQNKRDNTLGLGYNKNKKCNKKTL